MMFLSRKNLVQAAILSMALGVYQVLGLPAWNNFVAGSGAPLGVGEEAVGYFIVICVAFLVSWWITRNMDLHVSR